MVPCNMPAKGPAPSCWCPSSPVGALLSVHGLSPDRATSLASSTPRPPDLFFTSPSPARSAQQQRPAHRNTTTTTAPQGAGTLGCPASRVLPYGLPCQATPRPHTARLLRGGAPGQQLNRMKAARRPRAVPWNGAGQQPARSTSASRKVFGTLVKQQLNLGLGKAAVCAYPGCQQVIRYGKGGGACGPAGGRPGPAVLSTETVTVTLPGWVGEAAELYRACYSEEADGVMVHCPYHQCCRRVASSRLSRRGQTWARTNSRARSAAAASSCARVAAAGSRWRRAASCIAAPMRR